jgi:hypothetical protein
VTTQILVGFSSMIEDITLFDKVFGYLHNHCKLPPKGRLKNSLPANLFLEEYF